MSSKNKKAMYIAIIAGILLLIEGISGLATMNVIKDFVTTHIADNQILQIIFTILIFIASLGGIAVIIGGIIIGKNHIKTGKILIIIGVGIGIIGLIVAFIVAYMQNNLTISSFL